MSEYKYKLLKFETVEKAVQADSLAMKKVLQHYIAYIYSFSKDESGINYAMADEIKSHFLQAILKFNIWHD